MTTVTLLPPALLQFCDANGVPMANGTITFYVPSTTTPKDTWQDIGRTVLNQNPLTLDPAGRAIIFGDGAYRMVLKDAAGNTVWDQTTTTSVSSAMAPVTLAPDIATAQSLLGIDETLPAQIAAEAAARIAADNAEAAARAAGDSGEAAIRTAADNVLETQITTEGAVRAAQDAGLQAQINALSGSSIQGIRAGTTTSDIGGIFTVTFSPAFATRCVWAFVRLDMFGDDEAPNAHASGFVVSASGFTAVDMTGTGLHSATWGAIGF